MICCTMHGPKIRKFIILILQKLLNYLHTNYLDTANKFMPFFWSFICNVHAVTSTDDLFQTINNYVHQSWYFDRKFLNSKVAIHFLKYSNTIYMQNDHHKMNPHHSMRSYIER